MMVLWQLSLSNVFHVMEQSCLCRNMDWCLPPDREGLLPHVGSYTKLSFEHWWFSFVNMNDGFCGRMDVEADYIWLLLVASAGYDPRVALVAREKKGKNNGGSRWKKGRNNGGSRWEKMRGRLLVLHMEEALSTYREVMVGKDV